MALFIVMETDHIKTILIRNVSKQKLIQKNNRRVPKSFIHWKSDKITNMFDDFES